MNLLRRTLVSFGRASILAALVLILGLGSSEVARAASPPSLFLVSAGVSEYTDMRPLRWGHKDALDIANFYQSQHGKLFHQVDATTLINSQATVANITYALQSLQTKSKPSDYVIVFLAGHGGKSKRPEYGYCAYDRDITWTQLQDALRPVPGKILVMLDTCEAGSVTYNPNLIVFCSSLAHQMSTQEQSEQGNGLFTKALLEALRGRGDADGNGAVTLAEVDAYVASRVEQISHGKQSPTLMRPPNVPSSMPLAVAATS